MKRTAEQQQKSTVSYKKKRVSVLGETILEQNVIVATLEISKVCFKSMWTTLNQTALIEQFNNRIELCRT